MVRAETERYSEERRLIALTRAQELAEGKLVLLGYEQTGTYTVDEIYELEAAGMYVVPTAFGIHIFGPPPPEIEEQILMGRRSQ